VVLASAKEASVGQNELDYGGFPGSNAGSKRLDNAPSKRSNPTPSLIEQVAAAIDQFVSFKVTSQEGGCKCIGNGCVGVHLNWATEYPNESGPA
jgi:hypothetical protein